MKKQFSKRIGAILTMTAMLMTLLPMAIPAMATGEGTGNLLTNGDFASGNLTGWTAEGKTEYLTIYNTTNNYGVDIPALKIQGKGLNKEAGISQVVDGLRGETSYSLSMSIFQWNAGNNFIKATVTFGNCDGEGNFTPLADYTGAEDLMEGMLLTGGNDSTVTSSVSLNMVADDEDVTGNYTNEGTLNFILPPHADAVKVTLIGSATTSTKTLYIDDIVLKECSELINNGSFVTLNTSEAQGWTNTKNTYVSTAHTVAGDSYMKMWGGNINNHYNRYTQQNLTLRHGNVYKLSLDFAHCGEDSNAAPDVSLLIPAINGVSEEITVPVEFTDAPVSASSDSLDWNTYEAYIAIDKPAEDYAYNLVNAQLKLNGRNNGSWSEDSAVYYDNISLVEIDDAETEMFFSAGENGEKTEISTEANAASCIFVQGATTTVQKFIVAKYDSTTNALESATVVNAGDGIAAGNAKRYDVDIADDDTSYYRIFLFDGTTLKPILNSKTIG